MTSTTFFCNTWIFLKQCPKCSANPITVTSIWKREFENKEHPIRGLYMTFFEKFLFKFPFSHSGLWVLILLSFEWIYLCIISSRLFQCYMHSSLHVPTLFALSCKRIILNYWSLLTFKAAFRSMSFSHQHQASEAAYTLDYLINVQYGISILDEK